MVEKKMNFSKIQDATLNFNAIKDRKLKTEKAVLEDRFVSSSKSVVLKSNKAGKKRE